MLAWWGTRKWLVHLLIWIAIINGFAGLIAWAEGQDGEAAGEVYSEAVQVFFIIGGITAALGVVSTTQGAIVGEKQLGTAAWLMSKPVSRSAFVLAKLLAHASAFVVLAIALPAMAYRAKNTSVAMESLFTVPHLLHLRSHSCPRHDPCTTNQHGLFSSCPSVLPVPRPHRIEASD
jgi:ABC-type multidrug transport system permease subunit